MSWIYRKCFNSDRNLHWSTVNREKDVSTRTTLYNSEGSEDLHAVPLRKFDKMLFVWSGKYKRIADVPNRASRTSVAKAQSVCRIKFCNYMIIAVIIAAGWNIMSGKKDAKKGLTVAKMSEDWHKEYNARYEEEQKKKLNS